MFLIRLSFGLCIAADALWTVALLVPALFGALTGRPDFQPDFTTRMILAMCGSLMAGWTLLLLWAVRSPVERRAVALLTAVPVLAGMFIVSLLEVLDGNRSLIWILAKTTVLFLLMVGSYILARRQAAPS